MDNQKEPTAAKPLVHKDSIPNKLLEFQKRVSAISKDSVNPFFKSKYFDVNTVIDTIKPVLNEIGLVVAQPFDDTNGRNTLMTMILDGDKVLLESRIMLPEIVDVQKFGAAITYFRRYALVSLLLLQGEEDDDGNQTTKVSTPAPKVGKKAEFEATGLSGNTTISRKQALFIKSLRTEKGLDQIADDDLRKMTSLGASKEIKRLQELNDFDRHESVIQIEGPYKSNHEGD